MPFLQGFFRKLCVAVRSASILQVSKANRITPEGRDVPKSNIWQDVLYFLIQYKSLTRLFFFFIPMETKEKTEQSSYKVAKEPKPKYTRHILVNRVLTDPKWSINENA